MGFENDLEERPVRTMLKGGAVAIGIIAGISMIGWGAKMLLYPVVQAGRVVERTLDADNMIRNYEWFKQQINDVKAIDLKIANVETNLKTFSEAVGARETWTFDDRQEWNRLNAILVGLQGQRAQMVADYNARTKMENRDLFRTNDLPEELH